MNKTILISIIVLGFILRFYQLDTYPALNADEAALGYNAYSLLETGKDEHGNPWPLHFQSFNDYKPGLYVYLIMPFIKLLGLNVLAVRIPGALLGVITIFIVYLLAQEIGKDLKSQQARLFGLLAAFLIAINPWHIHFSRGGWEVNVATLFITAGTLFFLKGIKNFKYLYLGMLFFVLSLYTYHAARVIVPLLGVGLVSPNFRALLSKFKSLFVIGFIGLILIFPLIRDFTGPAGLSRASGVGLFSDLGPFNRTNEQRGQHDHFDDYPTKIMHNKPVNYTLAFIDNWFMHYHGEYLFLSGDEIQRNKVPETGLLHLIEALFILVGIVSLMRSRFNGWKLVVWWLLIAPIPAALTFQAPHALRSHNMVIPLSLISAWGLYEIVNFINKRSKPVSLLLAGILSIIVVWNVGGYLHMYYVHMAKQYSFSSQYGVKELVSFIEEKQNNYEHIVITDRYDQPYILFLFYMKYPPAKFQENHELTPRDQYGFSTVQEFDKYVFRSITNWDLLREEYRNALIAGTDEEIFEGTNVVKRIYLPSGEKAFEIVAN